MTGASGGDADRFASLRSAVDAVDGDRLKRVGVATYFVVYALIALGGWRALGRATQGFPGAIQTPAFAPLHVLLGLPRSVAWSIASLSVTAVMLGILIAVHVGRDRREDPPSLDDIGGSTWRDRWQSVTALRRRLPDVVGGLGGEPEPPPESRIEVLDGSLVAPVAPLSLPGPAARLPSVAAQDHAIAEGFTSHPAGDTAASGVTDGGVARSGNDGPWPGGWRGGDVL